MRKLLALVLALGLAAPAVSQQLNSKDVLSGFALRDNFRDRRAVTRNLFAARLVEEPPIKFTLVTGVGYSDAGGGVSTTSLPQELEIKFNNTDTTILLDIDAYDWVRVPNANVSGVGDPSVEVIQRLWCSTDACETNSDAISVSAGVTVPSGSDVSGGTAGQTLKFLWGHQFVDDSIELSVRLDHVNNVQEGVSNYATTGKLYYQYNFTDDLDVFANVAYSYQSGTGSVTVAGAGVDFPIWGPLGPFKSISGTLLGSCALSGPHHCGRVELNFVLAFN